MQSPTTQSEFEEQLDDLIDAATDAGVHRADISHAMSGRAREIEAKRWPEAE